MNNLDQPEFLPAPPPATPGSPQPPAPQKVKRFGWPTLIITAVLALGVGGLAGGSGNSSTASPQPTVTVTEPASEPDFTEEPTDEPAADSSAIEKTDFKLSIKEKSKKCYGYGVGCTIEYKVDMAADQTGWPDEGTIDLVYKITGGSEGAETNTITVDAAEGTYEQDGYQYADTSSRGVKLKISIVSIDYSEF